eukprot:5452256-Pyramimonas_sp.AAC.7
MPPKRAAPKRVDARRRPSQAVLDKRIHRLKADNSRLREINRQRDIDMAVAASVLERAAKKLRARTASGRRHSELLAEAADSRTRAERLRSEGAVDKALREEKLAAHYTTLAHGHKKKSDNGSPDQQPKNEDCGRMSQARCDAAFSSKP